MNQIEFNELFRQRTKKLALAIIQIVSSLKYTDAVGVVRKQLIKACTSTAANFRAVCRARSERERYAKLCIVVEEADETVFWIEMLVDGGMASGNILSPCKQEAEEILYAMAAYKKKFGS